MIILNWEKGGRIEEGKDKNVHPIRLISDHQYNIIRTPGITRDWMNLCVCVFVRFDFGRKMPPPKLYLLYLQLSIWIFHIFRFCCLCVYNTCWLRTPLVSICNHPSLWQQTSWITHCLLSSFYIYHIIIYIKVYNHQEKKRNVVTIPALNRFSSSFVENYKRFFFISQ